MGPRVILLICLPLERALEEALDGVLKQVADEGRPVSPAYSDTVYCVSSVLHPTAFCKC